MPLSQQAMRQSPGTLPCGEWNHQMGNQCIYQKKNEYVYMYIYIYHYIIYIYIIISCIYIYHYIIYL